MRWRYEAELHPSMLGFRFHAAIGQISAAGAGPDLPYSLMVRSPKGEQTLSSSALIPASCPCAPPPFLPRVVPHCCRVLFPIPSSVPQTDPTQEVTTF